MFSSRQTINQLISRFSPRLTDISKRFYYADLYADLSKNKARIVMLDDNRVGLQSLTSASMIGPSLKAPTTWRKMITGRDWSNVLVIEDDKIEVDKWSRLSDESWGSRSVFRPLANPPYTIHLKELYAIPQGTWEAFIDKLNNKVVVDKLNLKKHRHLWGAYNSFNPYTEYRMLSAQWIRHAELIGNYHFLISLDFDALSDVMISDTYRGRDFRNNPKYTLDKLKRCYFEDNVNLFEMLSRFHPCFTPLFLKKVAHIADFKEAVRLADMVLSYSATYKANNVIKYIDPKRKQDAVHWLPSSLKQPIEAGSAALMAKSGSMTRIEGCFFSARKSWGAISESELANSRGLRDYLDALFNDLIKFSLKRESFPLHVQVLESIVLQFRQRIFDSNSFEKLLALQNRWHRNFVIIESLNPKAARSPRWEPLMQDLRFFGVKMTALTSKFALESHGEVMEHCVGSYADRCFSNTSDIIELSDSKGCLSTLEVMRSADKVYFKNQHRSYNDTKPSIRHKLAANALIAGLNLGLINENVDRVNEDNKHREDQVVYHSDLLEAQEKLYDRYLSLKLLPACMVAKNYQSMLAKIGLDDLVKNVIETGVRLSRS